MDEAILDRLFELYGYSPANAEILSMAMSWLANSSVATIPALPDFIHKGKMSAPHIENGMTVIFASVSAGMNINVVVNKF